MIPGLDCLFLPVFQKPMIPLLRVACLATVLLCTLAATPVTVGDFSFEVNTGANAGNNLTAGGYHFNLDPDWKETAGPNNGAGFEEYITGNWRPRIGSRLLE